MNRLREVRVLKRITQFRLRLETGINPSKISLAENGLTEFSEDEEQKLAKALNVPVSEIFPDRKTSTKR
jgi:transcriptional regulator with XRE-family HTH domain